MEHSVEVHLPFIQYFLKNKEISLMLAGEVYNIEFLHKIHKYFDLIIVSSDLSHYLSYEEAKKRDLRTIELILKKDIKSFIKEGDACGKEIIKSLLYLAKRENLNTKLLKYLNSGDTFGDKSKVVGYSAIAFYY
jgi:AmmeMemoRadiSam system protein B